MVTLLRGGWLAAWDGAQHRIIKGGEVAFDDDDNRVRRSPL